MLGKGRVSALSKAPLVSHNAMIIMEDLHCITSKEGLNLLATKLIGNAVIMPVNIDVVIDIDRWPLEVDVSVPHRRQRFQIRSLNGLEKIPAAAV